MRTHIPDHATGRTYCGRLFRDADRPPVVWVIDTARDCLDDAACTRCQRVDDRRQADAYARVRASALFDAACKWAARVRASELAYLPRRKAAVGYLAGLVDDRYTIVLRLYEELELDAVDAGAL